MVAIVGVTTPESFTKSSSSYFQNENGEFIYGITGGDDGTAVIPTWGGVEGKVIKANIKEIGWEEGFVFTSNGRSSTMAPRPVEALQEFDAPVPELPEWEQFFNNFVEVIEGKAELIVTHEENRTVMKVLDACFRSVENGTVELIK